MSHVDTTSEASWLGVRAGLLLGTAQGGQAPALPGGLRSFAEGGEPAALLGALAALTAYRTAGAVSAGSFTPFCSVEETLPECGLEATDLLERIVAIGHGGEDYLSDWLRRAAQGGYRIPAGLVPMMMVHAPNMMLRALEKHRADLRISLGKRAGWLRLIGLSEGAEVGGDLWRSGRTADRCEYLSNWRSQDPDAALQGLSDIWKQESAESRLLLLNCLSEGLSNSDEPFLDAQRGDRSEYVRRAACTLLLQLPQSSFADRAADRAAAAVTFIPSDDVSGKRARISVTRPVETDESKSDDLMQHAWGGRDEEKFLEQVIARAPLRTWSGNSVSEWMAAALVLPSHHGSALGSGWSAAASRENDQVWLEGIAVACSGDLPDGFGSAWPRSCLMSALGVMDATSGEAILTPILSGTNLSFISECLTAAGWEWSQGFTDQVVRMLTANIEDLNSRLSTFRFGMMAARANPSSEPGFRKLSGVIVNAAGEYAKRRIEELCDALAIRREMTRIFPV